MINVLEVAVLTPVRRTFDYLCPPELKPKVGGRVLIPFGRRQMIGVVMALKSDSPIPQNKLKPIKRLLDRDNLLGDPILSLCKFARDYYHYPIGDIFQIALPKRLRGEHAAQVSQQRWWRLTSSVSPSFKRAPAQQEAYNYIRDHQPVNEQTLLLQNIQLGTLKRLQEKNAIESYTTDHFPTHPHASSPALTLNPEQALVLKTIQGCLSSFAPFLLAGVTGSGKTEVYLQLIANVLERKQQALVLVPEISLTPQTLSRFQQRFQEMIVTIHSGMSERARCDAWLLAKQGEAKIVIGTRSAIFTPLPSLGIIIIDEEHDLSFKQQDTLRYHARDLAMVRAKQANIPIVLGSATPSLESIYNAKQGKYYYCHLTKRTGTAKDPKFCVIDSRRYKLNEAGLSQPLIDAMQQTLDRGEQVLLFINRRGYAPVLMCQACGFMADCDHCESHLTVHQSAKQLMCHHCGYQAPLPLVCPSCQSDGLSPIGVGTEKIADALIQFFPKTKIIRVDRDSTRRKGALSAMLATVHHGEPCILVGTQILAKGHHFKKVTCVGILNADNGLFNPDFRGIERFGQLMVQVIGRAGRDELPGHVYIQTAHPDNQLLQILLEQGYLHFAEHILTERQLTRLPPYAYLALLRVQGKVPAVTQSYLQQLKPRLVTMASGVNVFGPIPAAMPKRAGKYHFHLLLQSGSRQALQQFSHQIINYLAEHPPPSAIRWQLELDPQETV